MAIAVRPADLDADRRLIIGFLSSYLTPLSNADRFDWLYLSNPHGRARAWVAVQDGSDRAVGVAAAFPRRARFGANEKLLWILGDFCVDDEHRSLGPALLLQRACLTGLDASGADFCYDLPSASMMAVYRRLHIAPATRMLRLAQPLRIDRKVREIVKIPSIAAALSAVGNLLIGLSRRSFNSRRDIVLSRHTGRCGAEFSALARKIGGQQGLCIERSAEYLNWRYLDNPTGRYEMLTARHEDVLAGYAVFVCDGEDATLVDLFGASDEVIDSLVRATTALVWAKGAVTLSAPMGERHPALPLMFRLGFRTREASPVVVCGPFAGASNPAGNKMGPWLLMHGDRDS